MIVYPGWWRGGRWNPEPLLRDLFTFTDNKAADGLTGLRVERFFANGTDREAWIKAGNGFLLVHRRGGNVNPETNIDEVICEIAALTNDADESNKLTEYVGSVFDGFKEGGTVHRSAPHLSGLSTTFMAVPGEVVGPQLIPELTRDERYVSSTWQLHVAVPHGLPDYRELLELDNE